jgi:hypothetical protein
MSGQQNKVNLWGLGILKLKPFYAKLVLTES